MAVSLKKHSNIHFGIYHSMFEWYNPLFLDDQRSGYKTRIFAEVYKKVIS